MFWFKACPRCESGDLSDGKDAYGEYISCQQCGHHLTNSEEAALLSSKIQKEIAQIPNQAYDLA